MKGGRLNNDNSSAQEQLRATINHAPVAVAMFDRQMRYMAASARWLSDYEIAVPFHGRAQYELFPQLTEQAKALHRRALSGETVSQIDDCLERNRRAAKWMDWTAQPWIGSDGAIGGVLIWSEDTTARRRVKRDRDLFMSLAQSSLDFIGMCDASFKPFFVNAAGMRMVGLDSLEEAMRTPVEAFFFPEDRDCLMTQFFPRVLREGHGEIEIRFRHFRTGEALWMNYAVYSLAEVASAKTSGYATVSRNITRQRQARQQLVEAQRRLQAIMDAAPVGLSYSEDRSCERVTGNAALFAQFEADRNDNVSASATDAQAVGRQMRFFRQGRELADRELPLQRAVAEQREIGPMELEVALPSGRRWWAEASGAPIRDERGEVVGGVAVTVDVTERRRAQDALRDADRRKNEFLAMLAHELRNPLAPICYGAHTLSKGVKNPQDTQRLVAMMERQLAHLVRLVDELLDVARISSGRIELKKQRLALADVIGQAIETIENRIQSAGHALILAPSREQLFVDGDCVRLVQVFGNLLANAAKYTDPGGRVELLWAREGNSAVVTVRDNGIGVEPSMLASIFDLFTRVKEDIGKQREGIGVGLALAKRLVELHGGQVEARSAGLGQGAEFIVRLPLAAPASGQDPAPDGAAMEAGALRR